MSDAFHVPPSPETVVSQLAAIRAKLRASPLYCPPCPLCSVVGHHETPDIIVGPSVTRGRRSGQWAVRGHKCPLLREGCGPWFDAEQDAAAWWRDVRLSTLLEPPEESRRANNLLKLKKDWEPV